MLIPMGTYSIHLQLQLKPLSYFSIESNHFHVASSELSRH